MDKLGLDFLRNELEFAGTLLRLAETEAASDPAHAARATHNARIALETVRKFLPKLNAPDAQRAALEKDLAKLEAALPPAGK